MVLNLKHTLLYITLFCCVYDMLGLSTRIFMQFSIRHTPVRITVSGLKHRRRNIFECMYVYEAHCSQSNKIQLGCATRARRRGSGRRKESSTHGARQHGLGSVRPRRYICQLCHGDATGMRTRCSNERCGVSVGINVHVRSCIQSLQYVWL